MNTTRLVTSSDFRWPSETRGNRVKHSNLMRGQIFFASSLCSGLSGYLDSHVYTKNFPTRFIVTCRYSSPTEAGAYQ
jgi:hypothetical protein